MLKRADRVFLEQQANTHGLYRTKPVWVFLLSAMRIHQWTKNFLIFVPVALAHSLTDLAIIVSGCIAFISFSICASGMYIFNDIVDIHNDRFHPNKKFRSIASGAVSIVQAASMIGMCLCCSLLTGYFLIGPLFAIGLGVYIIATALYTYFIKKMVILDVMLLAAFYTVRIYAGGIACKIEISPWLAAFSLFFFLSLALLKRHIELADLNEPEQKKTIFGRGYMHIDDSLLRIAGITAGFISIVIFALYITTSINVLRYYRHPAWLWSIIPMLVYWLLRIWLLADRREVDGDPVLFAAQDPASIIVALCALCAVMVSS